MKYVPRLSAICLVLILAGCGATLVAPEKPVELGNSFNVVPQRPWNRIAKSPEIWTAQGPQIDMVRFFAGIRSGEPLMSGLPDARYKFEAKMLPNDVQDLVVATLQAEGNKTIQASNLAPCPFGQAKGFCFDLTFASPGDLEMKGMAMARKQDERLDLILFQAPAEYYFGEMSSDVGKLFASTQVKQ